MAATREDIKRWLDEAEANNQGEGRHVSHLLIVCDTFSWEDYPVRVYDDEDYRARFADYDGKNMQRVMDSYNMRVYEKVHKL